MNLNAIREMLWLCSPKEITVAVKKKLALIKPLEKFNDNNPCVFVLSTGRVGTKTLSALFNCSKGYVVHHEPVPKLFRLGKASYEFQSTEELNVVFKEALMLARTQLFDQSLKVGCGYIETSPQVTFLAKYIDELLPVSKFIHLVRDPREVIRSGMRRNWFNDPVYDQNRITPKAHSICRINWGNASDLEKNIWLWAETNSWILEFEKTISSDRFLRVYSSNIFNAQPGAIERLFHFIHRDEPSQKTINKILLQKMNKQNAGEFPKIDNWTDEMNERLRAIAGPTMEKLNYDVI